MDFNFHKVCEYTSSSRKHYNKRACRSFVMASCHALESLLNPAAFRLRGSQLSLHSNYRRMHRSATNSGMVLCNNFMLICLTFAVFFFIDQSYIITFKYYWISKGHLDTESGTCLAYVKVYNCWGDISSLGCMVLRVIGEGWLSENDPYKEWCCTACLQISTSWLERWEAVTKQTTQKWLWNF